jgi:hypothetical protein
MEDKEIKSDGWLPFEAGCGCCCEDVEVVEVPKHNFFI